MSSVIIAIAVVVLFHSVQSNAQGGGSGDASTPLFQFSALNISVIVLWATLLVYSVQVAPNQLPILDMEMLRKLLNLPLIDTDSSLPGWGKNGGGDSIRIEWNIHICTVLLLVQSTPFSSASGIASACILFCFHRCSFQLAARAGGQSVSQSLCRVFHFAIRLGVNLAKSAWIRLAEASRSGPLPLSPFFWAHLRSYPTLLSTSRCHSVLLSSASSSRSPARTLLPPRRTGRRTAITLSPPDSWIPRSAPRCSAPEQLCCCSGRGLESRHRNEKSQSNSELCIMTSK